jgi:hypothetical protein
MKSSIAEVLRRIRPLSRAHKIAHLRGLIACEKKRSFRRAELEAALKPTVIPHFPPDLLVERKASA